MKHISVFFVLILITSALFGRQIDPAPPAHIGEVSSKLALPDGEGAWTIQVITRGGFDGRGRGDIVLTSKGNLNCTAGRLRCEKEAKKGVLDAFVPMVASAATIDWGSSAFSGACFDCYVTFLSMQVRGRDGTIRTFLTFWDDSTRSQIAAGVLRMYDAMIALPTGNRSGARAKPWAGEIVPHSASHG